MSDNNIVNPNAEVQEFPVIEEATATPNEPVQQPGSERWRLLMMILTGALTNEMLLLTPTKKRRSTIRFTKALSKQ